MKTVTVHESKTTLSQLTEEAETGEEVIIMRGKEPVVRLVPIVLLSNKTVFDAFGVQRVWQRERICSRRWAAQATGTSGKVANATVMRS